MNTFLYASFLDSAGGHRATTLLANSKISVKAIFDDVLLIVRSAIPCMTDKGKYTTEQLCDPDYWQYWNVAQGRVAGMCLAFLVRRKAIGLELHRTPSGKGKKRYRLAQSEVLRRASIVGLAAGTAA